MQHFYSLEPLSLDKSWVTIGSFDGVHRGHQALIKPLVAEAHQSGATAVVVTFHPHPAVVLRGIHAPYYLTDPEEKADLLGKLGIDLVVTLPFTQELAALSAKSFITLLTSHLGLKQLWAGNDFALGHNRDGNIDSLQVLGAEMGFKVHIVTPINNGGEKISSSQIRTYITNGKVSEAAQLLGRIYRVGGKVIPGDRRGKNIGFPTANLEIEPERLLPGIGVYVTWVCSGSHKYPAVTNIGFRPTFENQPVVPRLEAHLLDFTGNLYEDIIQIEFLEFIRPEKRFSSAVELTNQIQKDIQFAQKVFEHAL